ncbi:nucleotidyltransferase [Methanobacterium alcaliphilum]|nr:nucleotidyltransferase [Methanobacterium alcaliphilum]
MSEIRLTQNQITNLKTGHENLRDRLNKDEISEIIIGTFLQGSYRRSTAVRPKSGDQSDVDIIVVTNLNKDEITPNNALKKFKPFLDKNYADKYEFKGRSIGISMSNVELDVVVTAITEKSDENIFQKIVALSDLSIEEAEKGIDSQGITPFSQSAQKFKNFFTELEESYSDEEMLYLPDREAKAWKPTNPIEQIRWTTEKNEKTNKHYINVVKSLKWWKKLNYPGESPKSYPLEHFIGDCCPDDISSVADGITLTLEKIVSSHPNKPFLQDRGVPTQDVFEKITSKQYDAFYSQVSDAADIAREAFDSEDKHESIAKWKELFGSKFPDPPKNRNNNDNNGGFSKRTEKTSDVPGGRFA